MNKSVLLLMAPSCSDEDINAEIARRHAFMDTQDIDLKKREELIRAMSDQGHPLHLIGRAMSNVSNSQEQGPICDAACVKARNLARAEAQWHKAKDQAERAPAVAARAEETYLLLKGGEKEYQQVIEARYKKHAETWAEGSLERNMRVMTDMSFLITDYKSLYRALPRVRELAVIREKQEDALEQAIQQRQGGAHAGDRRVVYETREIETLGTFRTAAIVVFYVILLVWLLFGPFFKDQMYKMWFVWVAIAFYVAWPWLTPALGRGLSGAGAWVTYQWTARPYRNVALTV